MIAVQRFRDLDALPAAARTLLRDDGPAGIFGGETWFRTVLAHAMPSGGTPLFLLASQSGQPLGILPLRMAAGAVESLTTPYSCAFSPAIAGTPDDNTVRVAVCTALARACRAWPVVRLDALDPNDPNVGALIRGAREAGLVVRRFDHFGNWHAPVERLDWPAYLADRPGPLRNTVRRKLAAAGRDGAVLGVHRDGPDLDGAIAAYEDVYARSWKQAEPFPAFNAALARALAPRGQMRLGLFRLNGQAVAAQIWLLANGIATVVKLAHDEAANAASPGTVLTAHMIRHMLETEHAREIDFGRGDDPYKQGWVRARRQKIGLLLIDPRHPRGVAAWARQVAGETARRIYRRRQADKDG